MGGRVQIVDGTSGDRRYLGIDGNGNALVSVDPEPRVQRQNIIPFRSYFENAGSSNMNVDGSVTPVEFEIGPSKTRDRFISMISFLIADANAILSKFGNITALTNGLRFFYEREAVGEIDLHEGLTTNWDVVRMCGGTPAFGTAVDAFRAKNVVGASEGYIPMFDMKLMMPPYGLKIDQESKQRLAFSVQDDLSDIDALDVIAYGFEVIPRDSDEYLANI